MDEQEYDALVDMWASTGWKSFITKITDLEKNFTDNAADTAVTGEQWQYTRGQIHQLRSILGFQQFVTMSWEQTLADKLALTDDTGALDVDLV